MDADPPEVVLQPVDDVLVAPGTRFVGRDGVALFGPQRRRHVDQILALVTVFGRLAVFVTRE